MNYSLVKNCFLPPNKDEINELEDVYHAKLFEKIQCATGSFSNGAFWEGYDLLLSWTESVLILQFLFSLTISSVLITLEGKRGIEITVDRFILTFLKKTTRLGFSFIWNYLHIFWNCFRVAYRIRVTIFAFDWICKQIITCKNI